MIIPGNTEVNFDNKVNGSISLDVDATSGDGPETITAADVPPGIYTHYVQNFSNEAPLSTSLARVVVYKGKIQVLDISVPTDGDSNLSFWHVLDFDAVNNRIKIQNKLLDSAPNYVSAENYSFGQ